MANFATYFMSNFFYGLMHFSSLNEKKMFVLNLTFKLEIAN